MELKRNTILIVEDDAGILELLKEKAEENGYNAVCHMSAKKALDWLRVNIPYLIILDYGLSVMNAKEFIAELKKNIGSIPPFVVATGQGDESIAVEMMKLGAKDYVIKDALFLEKISMVIRRVCLEIENESKLKLAEDALKESEDKYRTMIEYSNDLIWSLDSLGNFTFANDTALKLTGLQLEDWLGKSFLPLILEEDLPKINDVIKRSMHGENCSYELRFKKNDESILTLSINTSPVYASGKIVGLVSFGQDITDRKKADEALRASEQMLSNVIENFPGYILWKDLDARFLGCNNAFLKGSGLKDISEVLNKNDFEMPWGPTEGEKFRTDDFEVMHSGVEKSHVVEMQHQKNGRVAWFDTTKIPLRNEAGIVIGLLGVAIEITEKKLAEDALRASEELYRNLVERIPDGVYKSTPEGQFLDVNPAMVKILGYKSKSELMNIDIKKQLYFDESHRDIEALNVFNEEMPVLLLRKKDGNGIWVEDHAWYNMDENGKVISHEGVLRDITERKKAELSLQSSEAMLKKALAESSNLILSGTEEINYQSIADAVLEMSGAKYVALSLFNEKGTEITGVALSGVKEHIMKLSSYLGFDLLNKKWDFNPQQAAKVHPNNITIFNSFHETFELFVPKPVSLLLEKTFNLGQVALVKINKNSTKIGEFALGYTKGETLQNPELVELFANQIGLFIERKRTEKQLQNKMDEMTRFHRMVVGRELAMVELKKEINKLLKKAGEEPKYKVIE